MDQNSLEKAEKILESRIRLLNFSDNHSLKELLTETLNELERLTNSKIGFYHFIEPDQKTLKLQTWSSSTKKYFCKAEGEGQHYDISNAGIWADCVRERKPIIHNNYSTAKNKKGLPNGHAEIIRELVVPIFRKEKIVAILGVGNKETDYTEYDIDMVSQLSDVAWDITERKRIEESLIQSELHSRHLAENLINTANVIVAALDTNGIIKIFNKTAEKITGYSRNEVIGKNWFDIFTPTDKLPEVWKEFNRQISTIGIENTTFENPIFTKNGQSRHIRWQSNNIIEDGKVTGLISFGMDVTDNKDLIDDYKSLLNAIPDMMARIRYDGLIMDIKPGVGIYSQHGQSTVFRGGYIDDLPFGDKIVTEFKRVIKDVLEKGEPLEYSYPIIFDNQERFYYSRTVKNGDDEVIVIVRDVTESKMIENELVLSKDKAEQSNKLKLEFLANMSHDLRTPMNSIIGFSDLLKANNISKKEKIDYLNTIIENGKFLMALIDDIIDVSKIDANSLKMEENDFELNKLMEELRMTYFKQARDKNIDIILDIDINKNVILHSDKYRMRQILTNLISNAVKFTKSGYVKFGYKFNNDLIMIYVEDTGIGINKEYQKIIFNRFKQLNESGHKFRGAGLGLSISKSLVELLGFGDIKIHSEINKGSTFYFYVPYEIKHFSYISEIMHSQIKNKKINLRDKKILMIEDDTDSRIIMKNYLLPTKVTIFEKDRGDSEVLEIIKKENIDLVLLDIGIPGQNGYEILREIREYDERIPVIIESAVAMPDQRSKAYRLGCNEFLSKPFTREDFLNKIDNWI